MGQGMLASRAVVGGGLCRWPVQLRRLCARSLQGLARAICAASAFNCVLLEHQLALTLHTRGDLRAIYPVLVCELKHVGDGDL